MPRNVAINFLPGTRGRLRPLELRQIARRVLDSESVAPQVEVEIVLADDATVRDLNRLYRGKDEETDVLSFASMEGEPFLESPDEAPSLGEVIVSVPFVERQVAEMAQRGIEITVQGQLAHLLVHGLLHLIGLDHERGEQEEAEMREKEEALLTELGYEGRYVHGH
jgi:probable rRNA maturation factor